jgi:hypothetical protein
VTAARLSRAEAKALGVAVPASTRSTHKVARAPYHTRCMACGAVFTTQAAEDRHVDAVGGHLRFELIVDGPKAQPCGA